MIGECNCACMPRDCFVAFLCFHEVYYFLCFCPKRDFEPLLATHSVRSLCCGVCVMCELLVLFIFDSVSILVSGLLDVVCVSVPCRLL